MRIPRKKKKKIPKNIPYCYTPSKNNDFVYHVKPCLFYTHKKYNDMQPKPNWIDKEFLDEFGHILSGWCRLMKCEIEDQCKVCGIKKYRE